MKKSLLLLALLASCNIKEVKAIDDFIEGEANVAEKVVQDLSSPDPLQAPVQGPVMKMPTK